MSRAQRESYTPVDAASIGFVRRVSSVVRYHCLFAVNTTLPMLEVSSIVDFEKFFLVVLWCGFWAHSLDVFIGVLEENSCPPPLVRHTFLSLVTR